MKAKVTITETKEPRSYQKNGETKYIYQFMAKNAEGKAFKYETFSKTINDALVKDAEVEIEFEEKSRQGQDGNTYTDRTVNQMWVAGKPIREDKKGGGQYGGKDTQAQTAINSITDQVVALINAMAGGAQFADLKEAGLSIDPKLIDRRTAWLFSVLPDGKVIESPIDKPAKTKAQVEAEAKTWLPENLEPVEAPEMKTFGDYVFIMGKEFEYSEKDCKTALIGKPAAPKQYAAAFIAAKQQREAK
jgi:hypothetical protein